MMAAEPQSSAPVPAGAPVHPDPLDGYLAGNARRATVVATRDSWHPVVAAVEEAGSLFAWAAGRPEARALAGRGTAYAIDAPGGERWVVRHYRRGGAVARWLGDRYWLRRTPEARPIRELHASAAARARGIATPEVMALAVYPAGVFYRADIATREVAGARDLADVLWGEAVGDEERLAACAAAGRLVTELLGRGVVHRDLNVKNILIAGMGAGRAAGAGSPPESNIAPIPGQFHGASGQPPGAAIAWVIDLDGCRIVDRASSRERRGVRARLMRSVRKWEERTGRPLSPAERALLDG